MTARKRGRAHRYIPSQPTLLPTRYLSQHLWLLRAAGSTIAQRSQGASWRSFCVQAANLVSIILELPIFYFTLLPLSHPASASTSHSHTTSVLCSSSWRIRCGQNIGTMNYGGAYWNFVQAQPQYPIQYAPNAHVPFLAGPLTHQPVGQVHRNLEA